MIPLYLYFSICLLSIYLSAYLLDHEITALLPIPIYPAGFIFGFYLFIFTDIFSDNRKTEGAQCFYLFSSWHVASQWALMLVLYGLPLLAISGQ
jgi:hypothetical protein